MEDAAAIDTDDPRKAFAHVTDWVFDLDNTLYPRVSDLFGQIDRLITRYVMDATGLPHDEARALQKRFYREHGTTLSGMMAAYGTDPADYLDKVHQIDYSPIMAAPELVAAISALPGRKFIFTNADSGHAEQVLVRLGGTGLFDGIFDIRAADYEPKPVQQAYDRFLAAYDIDPKRAAMFEDLERNLVVPHETGMITVHVVPAETVTHGLVDSWELNRADGHAHVHHVTADLAAFLRQLV